MKLICNSYDGNSILWSIWYRNWEKFIDEFKLSVIVNNESQKDETIKGVKWASDIRGERKYPINNWSNQLIDLLINLEDEFVILTQDDYIISNWNSPNISSAIEKIKGDVLLDCIHLTRQVRSSNDNQLFYGRYFLNTQCAIWRREALLESLTPNCDPWCWELRGHRNLKRHFRIEVCHKDAIFYKAIIKQGKILKGTYHLPYTDYKKLVQIKGVYKINRVVGKFITFKYYIKCLLKF